MDVNERLRKMLDERGLTTYKMAELSGLSHTTLANVFKRNTVPSINTLQAICKGFGIFKILNLNYSRHRLVIASTQGKH